jgi:hypothetical protein
MSRPPTRYKHIRAAANARVRRMRGVDAAVAVVAGTSFSRLGFLKYLSIHDAKMNLMCQIWPSGAGESLT